MNLASPVVTDDDQLPDTSGGPRSRDADATRQLLLQSARRRFALDGYSATTVRDIARDAGVNVALINRYFSSKEGLFESCLTLAAAEVDRSTGVTLEQIVDGVVDRVSSALPSDQMLQLLLLLRSSGDERADAIRQVTLRSFAEKIAGVAGWRPDDASTDPLLLRAQIAIAAALGVALLRSSATMEPLDSATAAQLHDPIRDVFSALLTVR